MNSKYDGSGYYGHSESSTRARVYLLVEPCMSIKKVDSCHMLKKGCSILEGVYDPGEYDYHQG